MSDNRPNLKRHVRSHSWSQPSRDEIVRPQPQSFARSSLELSPQSPIFRPSFSTQSQSQPQLPSRGHPIDSLEIANPVHEELTNPSETPGWARSSSDMFDIPNPFGTYRVQSPEPEPSVRPKTYRTAPRHTTSHRHQQNLRQSSDSFVFSADPFAETSDPFSFDEPYASDTPFGQSFGTSSPFESSVRTQREHPSDQSDSIDFSDLPTARIQESTSTQLRDQQSKPYYPPSELDWSELKSTYIPDSILVQSYRNRKTGDPDVKKMKTKIPKNWNAQPSDQHTSAQKPTRFGYLLALRSRNRTAQLMKSDQNIIPNMRNVLTKKHFTPTHIQVGPKPTDVVERFIKSKPSRQPLADRRTIESSQPESHQDVARFIKPVSQMGKSTKRFGYMPVGRQGLGPIRRSTSMPNLSDIDDEVSEGGLTQNESAFLSRLVHLEESDINTYKDYQQSINLKNKANKQLAKRLTPRPTIANLQTTGQRRVTAIKTQVRNAGELAQRRKSVLDRAKLESTLPKKLSRLSEAAIAEESGEGEGEAENEQ